MIESLDGVDCESRGQTPVADVDPRVTIFVHPAGLPTAIFLLEGEKGTEVHFIPDSDRRASENPHGQSQSIPFASPPLLDTLPEDRPQENICVGVFRLLEETGHEEQEAFRSRVVARAIGIPPVDQDFSDPSESLGELVAATVDVEERQDVHADDWVKT